MLFQIDNNQDSCQTLRNSNNKLNDNGLGSNTGNDIITAG